MINSHATKAEREASDYYEKFVDKFKPKHTTDDCMTPAPVYEAVLKWAREEYDISDSTRIMRPFWPGADYQAADYSGNCVVIDNPPFSCLSNIVKWYIARNINFFLFAPTLTLFSTAAGAANYVVTGGRDIVYENGAQIPTSFVTNMGEYKIMTAPPLGAAISAAVKSCKATDTRAKLNYPQTVVNAARLQKIAPYVQFCVRPDECRFVRKIDAQKGAIFGGGFLISERTAAERTAAERAAAERAAAERAAAERAAAEVYVLSEREQQIIKSLGDR